LFKIVHTQGQKPHINSLEIVFKKSRAKIYLDQGGSLQELTLDGHELVKQMYPLTYDSTYASSILFPFASRVKDGTYKFNNKTYQLAINEKGLNNALHGLVYNKTFEILSIEENDDFASIILSYQENNPTAGFPYTYTIRLEYILNQSSLNLKVEIKNTDLKIFPFTLGWHPYFLSSNLYNSSLSFDSYKKIKLDNRNITESIEVVESLGSIKIMDQSFDDCYILETNEVVFNTPKYILNINASEKESFLQIYTPQYRNTIAIEPITGVSDSFNNGIGLKTLKPQETYSTEWHLKINDN
jgi:aldose 1-epimerase